MQLFIQGVYLSALCKLAHPAERWQALPINCLCTCLDPQCNWQPIDHQITNSTHPDHSRCWKWSLLLHTLPCISIKCSHSCVEVLSQKQSKIWHVNLWTLVSCAMCPWDFQWNVQVLHWFHPASLQWAPSILIWFLLPHNNHVCLNLFLIVWIPYLPGTVTSWNVSQNLSITFHMGIIHEHSVQCVNLKCHSDTSSFELQSTDT